MCLHNFSCRSSKDLLQTSTHEIPIRTRTLWSALFRYHCVKILRAYPQFWDKTPPVFSPFLNTCYHLLPEATQCVNKSLIYAHVWWVLLCKITKNAFKSLCWCQFPHVSLPLYAPIGKLSRSSASPSYFVFLNRWDKPQGCSDNKTHSDRTQPPHSAWDGIQGSHETSGAGSGSSLCHEDPIPNHRFSWPTPASHLAALQVRRLFNNGFILP